MTAFTTTLYERIATVYHSRKSGNWGTFKPLGYGRAQVDVDGTRALISCDAKGWLVGIVGKPRMIAGDKDLERAIKLALDF
jgi:hypothetical protein